MRLKKYLPALFLLMVMAGCDNCNSKKKIAQWYAPIDGSTLPTGTMIDARLKFIDGDEKIDSMVYTFNGARTLYISPTLNEPVKISTDTLKPGEYSLKTILYFKNKKEEHIANITLLSDIVPQFLKMKTGAVYPHSKANFTEGLFFNNGMVYESTGMNGNSFICRYKLGSTTPERLTTLANEYFGEGSMLFDNKLVQLTWKNGVGIVYDAKTLKKTSEFKISGEGWGLTYNGSNLIMSDGSHRLFFLDKESFAAVRILEVYDNKGRVTNLNELEYINGIIYANIWQTDNIVKIDAKTGKVLAYIDCEGLLTESEIEQNKADVLNGIAYDPQTKKIYITGKQWPKIFELKE